MTTPLFRVLNISLTEPTLTKADIIQSDDEGKKIFTSPALDQCRDKGECASCGLCCIAYDVYVPVTIPADVSSKVDTVLQRGLDPCKYLKETRDGLFVCGCHEAKDHPTLEPCRDWAGNNPIFDTSVRKDIPAYEAMLKIYFEKLFSHGSVEDIKVANKLCERGVIRNFRIDPVFFSERREITGFLYLCLNFLEFLPHALFEAINLRDWFSQFSETEIDEILTNETCIDLANSMHQIFVKTYAKRAKS